MQSTLIILINKFGYLAITFLIFVENIFPPIPSEIILSFSGFIARNAKLNLFLLIIFSTIGSVIGAIMLYMIGKHISKEKIIKFASSKLGKKLHLKPHKLRESIEYFNNHGYPSIFFGRFIPIIRSIISIPAGLAKCNFLKFILLTTFGSLIWNTIFILSGNMLGENWNILANFINKYSLLIFFLFIIFLLIKIYRRKKKIITIK